ncbi:hypothetical protein N658DRAFT_435763 [Parathielavia hyrcaniae]|uniref:DUF1996 domain-containing protein n=1 Tax=Parathielavia hyrcaniae TaxID=113614 RepID=A0AAN6PWE6_9PEZI|nr:hypothetical protein N658DRAFT_435763 [Parathielavia hyrcaniae]
MHHWASLAAAVALLGSLKGAAGQNMLRFACSQLVVDRVDPLVNPGIRYTPHLHQIVGGDAFNLTMEPVQYDPAKRSRCTSCSFVQDKSNYWTAVMFFRHRNGSYHRVPQVGNGGPQGRLINDGGLDVYYIPSGRVTAFRPGFRMLSGNAANADDSKVARANICHRCWTSTSDDAFVGGAPCTGDDTVAIPQDPRCKMIRQTIIFPACWDGKNVDSPDHTSHVSYGQGSGANGGGACPSTHPVKLPQVMYELMWNVSAFTSDRAMWPASGPALVYSMNLGGSAAHGDYVFGWEGDSLQRAMDSGCNLNRDCPAAGLTSQPPERYNACKIKQQAPEPVDGWLKAMPMGEMAIKA